MVRNICDTSLSSLIEMGGPVAQLAAGCRGFTSTLRSNIRLDNRTRCIQFINIYEAARVPISGCRLSKSLAEFSPVQVHRILLLQRIVYTDDANSAFVGMLNSLHNTAC